MRMFVSWKRFVAMRNRAAEYYDRAMKAEGTIQLLQMDGALGRLAAKLDVEEAKAARERQSSADALEDLRRELAAKDRLIAQKDRLIAALTARSVAS
jgi:hypothetical protein